MKSYLLSHEDSPPMGGNPSVERPMSIVENPDERLRTVPIEEASGMVVGEKIKPIAMDTEPVTTSKEVSKTAVEEFFTAEPIWIEASKKGKGNKGNKGSEGGGGGENTKAKESMWDDPYKVKPAVELWEREITELVHTIEERNEGEEEIEGKPVEDLDVLIARRDRLVERLEKGKARIEIGRQEKKISDIEDTLAEKTTEHAKLLKQNPDGDDKALEAEIKALEANIKKEIRILEEKNDVYHKRYADVRFEDRLEDRPVSPTLILDKIPTKADQSKVWKASKNTVAFAGGMVGFGIATLYGGFKDLWKKGWAFLKNPNQWFGGLSWRDFMFDEKDKKK